MCFPNSLLSLREIRTFDLVSEAQATSVVPAIAYFLARSTRAISV